MKKRLKALAASLAVLLCAGAQAADGYPSKPIRLVIPYATGGTTDIIGRIYAEKLGTLLGQSVIVENKAGANSMIGTSQVVRSDPDGYTLLLTTNVVVLNEFLYSKPSYHAQTDLTPIAPVVTTPYFLIVNSKLPVKSAADLIQYAKAHPGELSFCSSGAGGTPHLVGELFKLRTGTNLLHVPYKGTGPCTVDLAAGQVQIEFVGMPAVEPFVREGRLRVLAAAEEKRSALMPQVPTIQEEGFPGVTAQNWFGLLGPAGLPADVVKRVSEATAQVTQSEDFRKKMEGLGAEPMTSSAEAFKKLYDAERERWRQVIQANGLKIE
jgi:tripartite-type tricarboxylate transporter receptor subunit TctC